MRAVLGDGVDHVVHVDLDGHPVAGAHDQDAGTLQLRHDRVPELVGDVHHAGQGEAWLSKSQISYSPWGGMVLWSSSTMEEQMIVDSNPAGYKVLIVN
jgi:hypothetical protein